MGALDVHGALIESPPRAGQAKQSAYLIARPVQCQAALPGDFLSEDAHRRSLAVPAQCLMTSPPAGEAGAVATAVAETP